MEELHRLHKEVPFGWLLFVQELFGQRARKAAARGLRNGALRGYGQTYIADDLHSLSGPH